MMSNFRCMLYQKGIDDVKMLSKSETFSFVTRSVKTPEKVNVFYIKRIAVNGP